MVRGGGPVSKELSLEDYQKNNSDIMTVTINEDGSKTYTFVKDATIPEDTTIIFDESDKLVTEDGSTVNLDGKFDITQKTDGITRTTVNGTLNQTGSMEFGTITNGGTGVEVNSSNSWNLSANAEVKVDKLDNSTGIEVGENGVVSFLENVNQNIIFNFNDVSENAICLHINGGTVNSNGDVNLNILRLLNNSSGISIENGQFIQSGGSIEISSVDYESTGIIIENGQYELKNGSMKINSIYLDSFGISIENGQFIQSGGSMEISSFSYGSLGIIIENGQFIQSGGSMEISSFSNVSIGIIIENGQYELKNGSMKINSITISSIGIFIKENGQFIQSVGSMEISSVDDDSKGIIINDNESNQFDVTDLTIDNVSGKGIVSLKKMSNKGKVRVFGDGILYSSDGETETDPAPQLNTGGDDDNTIFTGTTYYGPVTLEQYQSLVGDDVLQKDGTQYTFIKNHNIDYGYTITFKENETLTINNGISVELQGKFVIPDTTDITRISNMGTFSLNASVGGRAEITFGDIICSENSLLDAIGIDNMGSFFSNTLATFNQNGKITFDTIDSNDNVNFKAYGIKTSDKGIYVMKPIESTTTSLTFEKIQNSGIGIYVGDQSSFEVQSKTLEDDSEIKGTITLNDKTGTGITGTGIGLSQDGSGSGGIFTNNGVVNFGTQNNPLTLPYSIDGVLVDPTDENLFTGTGKYEGY